MLNNEKITKASQYAENLTKEDVDLWNKLNDLCMSGLIPETLYDFVIKNEGLMDMVEDCIKGLAGAYVKEIIQEAEKLFTVGWREEDDWGSGLYNCDKLYLMAIKVSLLENFRNYKYEAFIGFNTKQLYVYLELTDNLSFVVDPPKALLKAIGRYDSETLNDIVDEEPLWLFDVEHWLDADTEV